MRFYRETLGYNESSFLLLRDLIHEKTSIFFNENDPELLIDKISARLIDLGLTTVLDYYYLLKYDDNEGVELKTLFNLITVNETYFFREAEQIKDFCDYVLPDHIKKYPNETLTIWSAACSTGEEPLTIAMMIEEKGLWDKASIEIVGSDASSSVLSYALNGLYKERSFRGSSIGYRQKYFTPENGVWRVNHDIHRRVKFMSANLNNKSEIAALACSRYIFCRNVFIYFSEEKIREIAMNFYNSMPSDSFLFLGVSESLLKYKLPFSFTNIGNSFAYHKM